MIVAEQSEIQIICQTSNRVGISGNDKKSGHPRIACRRYSQDVFVVGCAYVPIVADAEYVALADRNCRSLSPQSCSSIWSLSNCHHSRAKMIRTLHFHYHKKTVARLQPRTLARSARISHQDAMSGRSIGIGRKASFWMRRSANIRGSHARFRTL